MVESSNRPRIQFVELTFQEMSFKVGHLVSTRSRIVFWKKSPKYFEGNVVNSISKENGIELILDVGNSHLNFVNEVICLNFAFNAIEYFMRAKVVGHDQEQGLLTLALQENCFKIERRQYERLLTYPHHQVYLYLKFQLSLPDNVVSFQKNEQKKNEFLQLIDRNQKDKILNDQGHGQLEENEDLLGVRVDDVSSKGLAFLCNENEASIVKDVFERKQILNLVLNLNGTVFQILNAHLVYQVQSFQKNKMFKAGISFDENESLKHKIEELLGYKIENVDYQKEFEEFIKNDL